MHYFALCVYCNAYARSILYAPCVGAKGGKEFDSSFVGEKVGFNHTEAEQVNSDGVHSIYLCAMVALDTLL